MTHSPVSDRLPWLIYGATGVTGRLVVAEALARGRRPILAGRDAAALRELAEPLDLEWAAVPDFVLELPGVARRDLAPVGERALVAAPRAAS